MDPRTAKMSERRAPDPSTAPRGPSLYAQIVSWLSTDWLQAAGRGLSRESIFTGLDVGQAVLLYFVSLIAVESLDTAIHETSVWSVAAGVAVVLWGTYMAGRESKNLEK